MKQYLRRASLFLLPLLVVMALTELALRRIPNDYRYTHDLLTQRGESIELLILGNSHGYNGIDPRGFRSRAYNAANISQDHRRDLAIAKQCIGHLPKLRSIIIPVSYASIGASIEHGREPWRVKNYVIHMDMPEQASRLDHRFELLNNRKPVLLAMLRDYLIHGLDNRDCGDFGGAFNRPKPGLDFLADAKKTADRHTCSDQERILRNLSHLEALIALAAAHDARVHLFFPPMHPAYLKAADDRQLQLARAIGRDLAHRHGQVSYHDLSDDPRFLEVDFSNSDHLSAAGNRKLTSILADTLGL
jgi:hypothetical protein